MDSVDKFVTVAVLGAACGFAVGFNHGYRQNKRADTCDRVIEGFSSGVVGTAIGWTVVITSPVLIAMGIIAAPIVIANEINEMDERRDAEKKN